MSKAKKTIEITVNMIQGRSAIGNDQSGKTVFDLVKGIDCATSVSPKLQSNKYGEYLPLVGTATVIHPAIVFGTQEEFLNDMCRAIEKELLKNPDCFETMYGDIAIKPEVADQY